MTLCFGSYLFTWSMALQIQTVEVNATTRVESKFATSFFMHALTISTTAVSLLAVVANVHLVIHYSLSTTVHDCNRPRKFRINQTEKINKMVQCYILSFSSCERWLQMWRWRSQIENMVTVVPKIPGKLLFAFISFSLLNKKSTRFRSWLFLLSRKSGMQWLGCVVERHLQFICRGIYRHNSRRKSLNFFFLTN